MLKGTTKDGFDYIINDENLDDWDFLEYLAELDEKPQYIVKVAKVLLGADQYAKAKEFSKVNGRVSLSKMNALVSEILQSDDNTKN